MVHFYNYLSILNTKVSFSVVLKLRSVCLRKNKTSSLASLSSLEPPFQTNVNPYEFCKGLCGIKVKNVALRA